MGRNIINLVGQRFGRLTVLERDLTYASPKPPHWICQCDCGNIKSIAGVYLRNGKTKSCGCLQKEIVGNIGKQNKPRGPKNNLIGQKFGKLTVISLNGRSSDGHYSYLCECQCGRQLVVLSHSLTSGNTKSCGLCSHRSFGEEKIASLLDSHNIFYEQEKKFPSCKFPDGGYARFDFFIENRYLLEFDGKQHFFICGGWSNEASLQLTQERDRFKDEWCQKNNIPLLRIPYTKLDTLTFQDIWLPS